VPKGRSWLHRLTAFRCGIILNVTDLAAAHEMLEKLPLGQAHLVSFELIPIGPLDPLRWLQGMKIKP
jgi:hypothetical protein